MLHVVTVGQVGNDNTVYSAFHTGTAEVLEAVLHNRIQISHQYEGEVDVMAYVS